MNWPFVATVIGSVALFALLVGVAPAVYFHFRPLTQAERSLLQHKQA